MTQVYGIVGSTVLSRYQGHRVVCSSARSTPTRFNMTAALGVNNLAVKIINKVYTVPKLCMAFEIIKVFR
jgi:hypothetical protein